MSPFVFSHRDESIDGLPGWPTLAPLDARALPDRPTAAEADEPSIARVMAAIDALLARSPWASMYCEATAPRPLSDGAARARARQALGAGIGLRLSEIEPLPAPDTSLLVHPADVEITSPASIPQLDRIDPFKVGLPQRALG